jgi:hypothetical protein
MSQDAVFDDASIPVLTEFVDETPLAAPAPEPAPDPAQAAAVVAESSPAPAPGEGQLEARALDSWSAQEWDLLEGRLCERILQQLQGRVDFVLEQRLRDNMAEVLQQSLSGLTERIREGLQDTIEKIVVRAVSQELAHLQTLKK